jgi:hypothetical protein
MTTRSKWNIAKRYGFDGSETRPTTVACVSAETSEEAIRRYTAKRGLDPDDFTATRRVTHGTVKCEKCGWTFRGSASWCGLCEATWRVQKLERRLRVAQRALATARARRAAATAKG